MYNKKLRDEKIFFVDFICGKCEFNYLPKKASLSQGDSTP